MAPFALVPILRDDELLGVIEVDNPVERTPVADDALRTLASFALQAAVASCDAHVQKDASRWQDQVDEVFELDTVRRDVDELDDLAGGRKA